MSAWDSCISDWHRNHIRHHHRRLYSRLLPPRRLSHQQPCILNGIHLDRLLLWKYHGIRIDPVRRNRLPHITLHPLTLFSNYRAAADITSLNHCQYLQVGMRIARGARRRGQGDRHHSAQACLLGNGFFLNRRRSRSPNAMGIVELIMSNILSLQLMNMAQSKITVLV